MDQLKEFMLLFRMPPIQIPPSQEQIAAMHQQWQTFIGDIASQGKLVGTSRLGFEGRIVRGNHFVENQVLVEENQTISGNLSLKAVNIDEVVETAKKCPVLLAGGSVEVRPMLGMK